MSNLVTLTQDEIDKYDLKGKQVGDAITAEEYSKHQKEYEVSRNKSEDKPAVDTAKPSDKPSKK